MPRDYMPSQDAELAVYSATFDTVLSGAPLTFGITVPQSAQFTTVNAAWIAAWNVARNNSTRSPANIIVKDEKKHLVVANLRQLAGIIQKCPTVTNEQRSALGLTVHAQPGPIPAPATSPVVEIVSVTGRTVLVKMHDGSGSRRSKPAGTTGASIFSYTGATPPASIEDWVFQGSTTRTQINVVFSSSLAPGATVWLTAFWFNAKSQSGPACTPISTTFGAAGVSTAEAA